MNKINTNISIDPNLKRKSIELLSKLGLDFSTAISLFLNQVIIHNGLPFDVCLDEPNETTLAAFAEEKEMRTNKKKYKRYNTFAEYRKKIEDELKNE